jgi:hypothetical protein
MDALDRLEEIGFKRIGWWILANGALNFVSEKEMPEGNALYAFVSGRFVLYIGKSGRSIANRLRGYQRPGPTQRTNIFCNAEISKLLEDDKTVEVFVRKSEGSSRIGSFLINEAAALEDAIIHDVNPFWNRIGRALRPIENSMINFNSVKKIDVVWAYEGSSYIYQALPTSLRVSQDSNSISFVLREVDGQDQNFEVVIQRKTSGSYMFKTDYYEDPETEYPLKQFTSSDELLFYFKGSEGMAYFHLSSVD